MNNYGFVLSAFVSFLAFISYQILMSCDVHSILSLGDVNTQLLVLPVSPFRLIINSLHLSASSFMRDCDKFADEMEKFNAILIYESLLRRDFFVEIFRAFHDEEFPKKVCDYN